MEFADNSFDFIWSWGVIHHSADTQRVLREMHRVLTQERHMHRDGLLSILVALLFLRIPDGASFRTSSANAAVFTMWPRAPPTALSRAIIRQPRGAV